jgi:hypothetical protein
LLVPAVTSLERYFAAQLAMNSGLLVKHHTTEMPHPTVPNRLMTRVMAHLRRTRCHRGAAIMAQYAGAAATGVLLPRSSMPALEELPRGRIKVVPTKQHIAIAECSDVKAKDDRTSNTLRAAEGGSRGTSPVDSWLAI